MFQVETHGKHEGAYDRLMKTVEFNEKFMVHEEPSCFAEFIKVKPSLAWADEKAEHIVVNERVGLFWTNCDPASFTTEEWTKCFGYGLERIEEGIRKFRTEHGLDDTPKLIAIQDAKGLGFGM